MSDYPRICRRVFAFAGQTGLLHSFHGNQTHHRLSRRGQNGHRPGPRLRRAEIVFPKEIIAGDVSAAALAAFTRETGAKTTASNSDVLKFASVLILAVKPDQETCVLAEQLRPFHK